jgi:predicted transposase YbfD/YdcC
LLAGATDGRPGQGRDHPVAAVLALAAAAVVAGSRSFTAIAGWAADVPASVLADLYRRCGARRPGAGPPSKATIWRVDTGADTAALDVAASAWLMERAAAAGDLAGSGHGGGDDAPLIPVRVDGKTVRGARNADGSQVHLPAALAGQPGVIAGQVEVGAKTNEIPMIIPLLDGVDLDRAVVTADALHCQRATADYVHGRGADFVFPVKDNQPGLFDAIDALPWHDVPVADAATGRGRIETRTIQVLDAPADLPFPHVSQAYLIERHVTALGGTPLSDVAALGVTSLDATRASAQAIASLVRGQWAVESLHRLRDTLTAKTTPPSAPAPGHGPWPPSGTSPSEPCTRPGRTTPPRPPDGPAAAWSGPSPSSDSRRDLERPRGVPAEDSGGHRLRQLFTALH